MEQVSARTWCRVDFAGGTLDIWPLGLLHEGAVTVNLAIDISTRVTLRRRSSGYRLRTAREDLVAGSPREWLSDSSTALIGHLAAALELGPVDIEVVSESPRGGGLGASSAIAVAFVVAAERFTGVVEGDAEVRSRFARDVEARLMGLPTGLQDHLPALVGGLLAIEHRPGGERLERLEIDWRALADSLIVAYSGQTHFSAGNNWRIVRGRLDGKARVVESLNGIASVASEVVEAFRAGSLERVGQLMSEEWSWRRRLAEGISTERIEAMLSAARAAGAWGGKACGAGGGGCVAMLAPPGRRSRVVAALSEIAEVLPAAPVTGPCELHFE